MMDSNGVIPKHKRIKEEKKFNDTESFLRKISFHDFSFSSSSEVSENFFKILGKKNFIQFIFVI